MNYVYDIESLANQVSQIAKQHNNFELFLAAACLSVFDAITDRDVIDLILLIVSNAVPKFESDINKYLEALEEESLAREVELRTDLFIDQ